MSSIEAGRRCELCPACGSAESEAAPHELYDFCRECGSVYQARGIRSIQDYYEDLDRPPDNRHQIGSYRSYLEVVKSHVDFDPGVHFVDVGAGDGSFLACAREMFDLTNPHAVEGSAVARRLLAERGFDVVDVPTVVGFERKFVTALQVIEHVPDPVEFLEGFVLRTDDLVLLTSPSVDAVEFARYGREWKSYSPSHHLVLFSRQGIETVFDKASIDLIHFELCISATNSIWASRLKTIRNSLWYPVRVVLKGQTRRPRFYGKNSFLAIGRRR